jgi:hypothetical protein
MYQFFTWCGALVLIALAAPAVSADCEGGPVFDQPIRAVGKSSLEWDSPPSDIDFIKGPLSHVATFVTTLRASDDKAIMIDISGDNPGPGNGYFYLIKPSASPCGSWQSAIDAEPERDARIPAPCTDISLTDEQIDAAVQLALALFPDPWSDTPDAIGVLEVVQRELECAFDLDLAANAGRVTSLPDDNCDAVYCPDVRYCGRKNSTNPDYIELPASPCLNEACFLHDECYTVNCIEDSCFFTQQPLDAGCDAPLLNDSCSTCPDNPLDVGHLLADTFTCSLALASSDLPDPQACSVPPCTEPWCTPGQTCDCVPDSSDPLAAYSCEFPRWTQESPTISPSIREAPAMAYDSARAVTVLWGGHCGRDCKLSDTWEWDGTQWTEVTPAVSPPDREGHVMAYDSARGVMVMFGGFDELFDTYKNDIWEWDGAQWTEVTPAVSPPTRWYPAMVYDSARGVIVLFGGGEGRLFTGDEVYWDDTWEWDGTQWTEVTPAISPPARFDHAMAYDSARGVTVLFGGYGSDNVVLGGTWEWDGTQWTDVTPTINPSDREGPAMAYDSARGLTVLFGGFGSNNDFLGDTWEWDGTQWTVATTGSPSNRWHPGVAYDSARGATVMFGGGIAESPLLLDDTWSYGP